MEKLRLICVDRLEYADPSLHIYKVVMEIDGEYIENKIKIQQGELRLIFWQDLAVVTGNHAAKLISRIADRVDKGTPMRLPMIISMQADGEAHSGNR